VTITGSKIVRIFSTRREALVSVVAVRELMRPLFRRVPPP
jgi:hypothetical protein